MTHCPRPSCGRLMFRDGTCPVHGEPPAVLAAEVVTGIHEERAKRDPFRPWDAKDEAFARAAMGKLNSSEIAEALGRSRKGVKSWYRRNGLNLPLVTGRGRRPRHWSAPESPGPRRWWSDAEIEALEDGELRILMRARSWVAITRKASRFGQPVRSGDGAMSMRQVAERFAVDSRVVWQWIARGLLPARLSGRVWRVDPDVAERVVPGLKGAGRAANGRKGWWRDAEFRAWLDAEIEEINGRDRYIDTLVRS